MEDRVKEIVSEYAVVSGVELWAPVPDFPAYEVSTKGQVRNSKGHRLSQRKSTRGYLDVSLCKKGKRKHAVLHQLVAQAFLPNPHSKPLVDHIDGDKTNNTVGNLRWATHSENTINSPSHRGTSMMKGVRKERGKWRAEIHFGGKTHHLGMYNDEEDAGEAYNVVAKLLFKEFAHLNRVREGRRRRNERYYQRNKLRLKEKAVAISRAEVLANRASEGAVRPAVRPSGLV